MATKDLLKKPKPSTKGLLKEEHGIQGGMYKGSRNYEDEYSEISVVQDDRAVLKGIPLFVLAMKMKLLEEELKQWLSQCYTRGSKG
ncbi:hypothetical protein U1Q18_008123 [Sarracenia purpurea var. burkii]